jgi:ribosomal protein S21
MKKPNFSVNVMSRKVEPVVTGVNGVQQKTSRLNAALAAFKNKVDESGIMFDYRDKQYFLNKSERARMKTKRSAIRRRKFERAE